MNKEYIELEYSNFDKYPHYVFATAFLVDGKIADYKIGNKERCWGDRTFRGTSWEREVAQRLRKNDKNITCEYKKILVNNNEEHNEAFDNLEDWLFNNFKIYEKTGLRRLNI